MITGLIACSTDNDTGNPVTLGEELYLEPMDDGNSFSCATCHALYEPTSDGFRRPGHPIGDAAMRPSYKNGQVSSLLEAVNSCRQGWMAATAWTADDASWLALEEFLFEQATGPAPALEFERVDPPLDLGGGDSDAGRATFNGACVVCHGVDAAGTNRAPQLAGIPLEAEMIARRVRTSGQADSEVYPGLTGGIMPFWSASRLSDQELRNVIAFIEESEAGMGEEAGPLNIGGTRTCPSDHSLVGSIATLTTRFHDVSGTVTVVDDCHLRFDNFNYDGNGIDIKVYTGSQGDFQSGTPISANMFNFPIGYSSESFTLTLPPAVTLDDFDSVSIWCVDVATSFGDGLFN